MGGTISTLRQQHDDDMKRRIPDSQKNTQLQPLERKKLQNQQQQQRQQQERQQEQQQQQQHGVQQQRRGIAGSGRSDGCILDDSIENKSRQSSSSSSWWSPWTTTTTTRPTTTMLSSSASMMMTTRTTQCENKNNVPPEPPPLPPSGSTGSNVAPPPPPPPAGGGGGGGASSSDNNNKKQQQQSQQQDHKKKDGGGNDDDDGSIAAAARSVSEYINPGPYEQASMDSKRLVALDTFGGFRCDINKQLSPYMMALHTFWMGTGMLPPTNPDGTNPASSSYGFSTQIADESSLLMTRIDPGQGSSDTRFHKALLGGVLVGKLIVGVSTAGQNDQLMSEVDINGMTWTANGKYGSMGNGLLLGCNYFQSITPRIAVGCEGIYVGANQNLLTSYTFKMTLPAKTGDEDGPIQQQQQQQSSTTALQQQTQQQGGQPSETTIDGSSAGGSSTFCMQYNASQGALTVNYNRIVTPNRVTLGAELTCGPGIPESQVLVGGEFKFQRSKFSICFDNNLRFQALLEPSLGMMDGSPKLKLSADVDLYKDETKVGYGLTIGETG